MTKTYHLASFHLRTEMKEYLALVEDLSLNYFSFQCLSLGYSASIQVYCLNDLEFEACRKKVGLA